MGEEKRREPRVEAKLAIRLAYGTLDEFVERYALNVSRGGIFVRTRDPQPPGTAVSLDLQLATGEKVVRGRGLVAWTTPPSAPGEPHRDPGMGIRFTDLDGESRALVDLVVATQPAAGKGGEPPRPPGEHPGVLGLEHPDAGRAAAPAAIGALVPKRTSASPRAPGMMS
jgi:uncharacterized protein (TIGR02266 family)